MSTSEEKSMNPGQIFENILLEKKPTSLYEIFGLDRKASKNDIQKAFRETYKSLLLDEDGRNGSRTMALAIYHRLVDEEKRAEYDSLTAEQEKEEIMGLEHEHLDGETGGSMVVDETQIPSQVTEMLSNSGDNFAAFIREINEDKWSEDDLLIEKRAFKPLDDLDQRIRAYYKQNNMSTPLETKYHNIGHFYLCTIKSHDSEEKKKLSQILEKHMTTNNLPHSWIQAIKSSSSTASPSPSRGTQPLDNASKPTQELHQASPQRSFDANATVISTSWVKVSHTSRSGLSATKVIENFFVGQDEIIAVRPKRFRDASGKEHFSDQSQFFVGRNNSLSLQPASIFPDDIRKKYLADDHKRYIGKLEEAKQLPRVDSLVAVLVAGRDTLYRKPPTYFWCIRKVDGETEHHILTASALKQNLGGNANYNSFLRSAGVEFVERNALDYSKPKMRKLEALFKKLLSGPADMGMLEESQTEIGDYTDSDGDDDLFVPSHQPVQRRRQSRHPR